MILPLTFHAPRDIDSEWNRALADAIWEAALRCKWNLNELADHLKVNANNLGKALKCQPGTSLPTISRLARAGSEFWWVFYELLGVILIKMTIREQRLMVHERMGAMRATHMAKADIVQRDKERAS